MIRDVEPILTPYGKEVLTYDLDRLKIYVYPLPPKFNTDLVTCATQNKANAMCFDFSYAGFGPEMKLPPHLKVPELLSFHKTHQFSLEVIFYERLLRSPYITQDLSEADLVYVPFYAGLSCFCSEQTAQNLTSEFWSLMKNTSFPEKLYFVALAKVEQVCISTQQKFKLTEIRLSLKRDTQNTSRSEIRGLTPAWAHIQARFFWRFSS